MLTVINRRNLGVKVARASALCLLALAAVLFRPSEARAQWTTSGTSTTTTNNVGIGTATPSQMFHVHSIGTWAGTRVTTAATGTTINDGVHFGYDDAYGAYVWNREATSIVFSTSNLERMRVSPTGNVGIGTATPGVVNGFNFAPYISLHVQTPGGGAGSIAVDSSNPASGIVLNDSSQPVDSRMWSISQAAGGGKLSFRTYADSGTAPSDKFVIDRTGKVGVGTSNPSALFEVYKDQPYSGSVTSMTQVRVNNPNPSGFSTFSVWGHGAERGRFQYNAALPNLFVTSQGAIPLHLGTNDTIRLTVDGTSGNVGIGTATPVSKLHVDGDITVTGNINAKYQDVAEWVPSVEKLSAGTVVILDVARDNHVAASSTSYDTRVAGVISAQPGISLGEKGEGKVLVATTGRVKVRVDATQGPISIGDLLVTSDRLGFAMKSEPVQVGKRQMHAPGTIIGKALESLAGGTGEILVLLSLQ